MRYRSMYSLDKYKNKEETCCYRSISKVYRKTIELDGRKIEIREQPKKERKVMKVDNVDFGEYILQHQKILIEFDLLEDTNLFRVIDNRQVFVGSIQNKQLHYEIRTFLENTGGWVKP